MFFFISLWCRDNKQKRRWVPPLNSLALAMPSEFGGKWRAKCLNTRLPLPTLLNAYSVFWMYLLSCKKNILLIFSVVKLKKFFINLSFIFLFINTIYIKMQVEKSSIFNRVNRTHNNRAWIKSLGTCQMYETIQCCNWWSKKKKIAHYNAANYSYKNISIFILTVCVT